MNNTAVSSGGGLRCKGLGATPIVENCTFYGNSSVAGSALFCLANASPTFRNCLIAFNTGSQAVFCSDHGSNPVFECSNIFGNQGGDWLDCIVTQAASNDNQAADPLFCDTAANQ
jgi:hypothetical protein